MRAVRSFDVVLDAPRLDEASGMREAQEPVFVQIFVTELAVEAFIVGILDRLVGMHASSGRTICRAPDRRTPGSCQFFAWPRKLAESQSLHPRGEPRGRHPQ